jgi:hypothetical protein
MKMFVYIPNGMTCKARNKKSAQTKFEKVLKMAVPLSDITETDPIPFIVRK